MPHERGNKKPAWQQISMIKNKPAGHRYRGAASKNAGTIEDFWELRGLFLVSGCLEANTFTVLLLQFLLFDSL